MECGACNGLEAHLVQFEKPNWEPVLAVLGERLTEGFMWMHEAALSDGTALHAYKHKWTRRYLFLSENGQAFEEAACQRYVPDRLDFAIKRAICPWWILAGWEEADVEALRETLDKAPPSSVWKP
jgi:hypothetical protein